MNKGINVPMSIPAIGGNNQHQQPMFDISQAVQRKCECGSACFDKTFRVGLISKFAPGNITQQDITVETPVHVCHSCGKELMPLINNGGGYNGKTS